MEPQLSRHLCSQGNCLYNWISGLVDNFVVRYVNWFPHMHPAKWIFWINKAPVYIVHVWMIFFKCSVPGVLEQQGWGHASSRNYLLHHHQMYMKHLCHSLPSLWYPAIVCQFLINKYNYMTMTDNQLSSSFEGQHQCQIN